MEYGANGKQSDDNEKIMKFLTEMEVLQRTDPESFSQFLKTMGIDDANSDEAKLGRNTIIDAISQLRAAKNAPSDSEIELPGGQFLSGGEVKAKQKGINITPEPGFTLKTKMTSGSKVFINVCKHMELAAPSVKKKLDENGEEVEGMNIPLSAGPARAGKDKSGIDCVIYDVIVNPQVIDDVLADPTGRHRDFICQLCIQSIEQKNKLALDKRYKLPKIRYMGEIQTQLIQDRKNVPNIQDISSSPTTTSSNAASAKAVSAAAAKIAPAPVPDKPLKCKLSWRNVNGETLPVEYEDPDVGSEQYIPPLVMPDDDVSHIIFTCNFDILDTIRNDDVKVSLSQYKIKVKLPGYIEKVAYFPCAVHCGNTFSTSDSSDTSNVEGETAMSPQQRAAVKPTSRLRKVEGYTRLAELTVSCPVDRTSWGASADPGSRSWMVAEALMGAGEASGPKKPISHPVENSSEFAEDRFHIQLPDDVDRYTGMKLDGGDEGEFAEDKFHKQDAVSQYIIEQREKDIKAKWDKHEKEKAERGKDPNVEYVDVDDFKVGGKYGPQRSSVEAAAAGAVESRQDDLKKAAEVVATSFAAAVDDSSPGESAQSNSPLKLGLSSNLWTELLD